MSSDIQINELANTLIEAIHKQVPSEVRVYSPEQIADLLQVKESSVRNLIHRTKELRSFTVAGKLRIRHVDLASFLASRVHPCINDEVLS